MWKSITPNINTQAFYIKLNENTDKRSKILHQVFITNYVKLWFAEFDSNKLLKIMLDSNTGIDADSNEKFLKVGHQMLHQTEQLDKELVEDKEGHLTVKFILKKGIVFKMNFTLNVCSAEQFFDTVTRPLLSSIHDLRESESELRHYLEDIRVYLRKIPEDQLMRFEKLKIKEYNDENHMKTHSVMEKLLGNTKQSFDPIHILNGRPISDSSYYSLPVKEETELTDPGSSNATITVKSEPGHVSIGKEPKYPVKVEPNTAPITIKTEPTTVIAKPPALKRRRSSDLDSATSMQGSSDIKPSINTHNNSSNEASDLTTGPIRQSDDAIASNDMLLGPIVPNQTSPISNTNVPVGLLTARYSPNDRRKKLNY